MLGGTLLLFILVYLEMSMIFKFYKNMDCIDKLQHKGLSNLVKGGEEPIFLLTFLVTKYTHCSQLES
jgi:hypothetical protein